MKDRHTLRAEFAVIRHLLIEWDPLGLVPFDGAEDYDWIGNSLLHMLHEGQDARTIASYLRSECNDVYMARIRGHRAFARDLHDWFASRRSAVARRGSGLQPTWPAALPPSKLCHHGAAGCAAEPWSVTRLTTR